MRIWPFALVALGAAASAGPVEKLSDFELEDQNAVARTYQFPKPKITVMTIADHKGSNQLAPWIARIYERYEKRIDIDGVADVSMIPGPFHGIFREAFRKQLTYPVMLDWGGSVVKQFGHTKGVANIYVIDRQGFIVKHLAGPVGDEAARELFLTIDRVLGR
ncbi:MAG: hypothetical protein WCF18_00960 [Chthoniobacteraceae bacterium]